MTINWFLFDHVRTWSNSALVHMEQRVVQISRCVEELLTTANELLSAKEDEDSHQQVTFSRSSSFTHLEFCDDQSELCRHHDSLPLPTQQDNSWSRCISTRYLILHEEVECYPLLLLFQI